MLATLKGYHVPGGDGLRSVLVRLIVLPQTRHLGTILPIVWSNFMLQTPTNRFMNYSFLKVVTTRNAWDDGRSLDLHSTYPLT